jgi:hypothetical protein
MLASTMPVDTSNFNEAIVIGGPIFMISGIVYLVMAIGLWTSATKAGVFGLWAVIPLVYCFVFAKMAGKPLWWGLLCLIPLVNIVILLILMFEISKRFGRGVGTALGLFFLPMIFWPIVGLGSAEYKENN